MSSSVFQTSHNEKSHVYNFLLIICLFFFFIALFLFWRILSPWISGCLGAHYIDQVPIEHQICPPGFHYTWFIGAHIADKQLKKTPIHCSPSALKFTVFQIWAILFFFVSESIIIYIKWLWQVLSLFYIW